MTPAEIAKCRDDWKSVDVSIVVWACEYGDKLLAAAERCAELEQELSDKDALFNRNCELAERCGELERMLDEVHRDEKDGIPTRSATYVHALKSLMEAQADAAAWRACAERLAEAGSEVAKHLGKTLSVLAVECDAKERPGWQQALLANKVWLNVWSDYRRLAGKETP